MNKRQRMVALASGPIISLFLAILLGYLSLDEEILFRKLFGWTAIYNVSQFIMTIIPIKYPGWMGGYKGFPSDGLQLIQLLRK